MTNNYTIIIPIHNALEDVKRCVESVLKNTPESCRVFLYDDGSTDQRVKDFVYLAQANERVTVWLSMESQGFVTSVNFCIACCKGDVIILNSDTIVPPGWVERIDAARCEVDEKNVIAFGDGAKSVAAVCPLSNNATAYSVPNDGEQDLPPWLTVDAMDALVQECSDRLYPYIPTVHGFCMLLTREAINAIGCFDEVFGRGYGEEVDWSRRAIAAGYGIVLADDLFVYHRGRASFGDERKDLVEAAEPIVLERWPDYPQHLHEWRLRGELRPIKTRLIERLRSRPPGVERLSVLLVQHNWHGFGGLEIYTKRMAKELASEVEFTILHPSRRHIGTDALIYQHPELGGCVRIEMNSDLVGESVVAGQFPLAVRSPDVERFFGDVLDAIKPDLVHVQHMGGFGTFRLPQLARDRDIPVVWGLHDHYQICPLMLNGGDCKKRECGGDDECLACIKRDPNWMVKKQITDDELRYALEVRSLEVQCAHGNSSIVTVPSEYLANEMKNAFGPEGLNYRVMPHGVDAGMAAGEYRRGTRMRVGWFGAGSRAKGFETFLDVCRLPAMRAIEFSVHSPRQLELDYSGLEHVKFRGPFADGELGTWLKTVDVAVVAASRLETYGSIVDEVRAHGVPMIVAAVPGVTERLAGERNQLWFYCWGSMESLVNAISEACDSWQERLLERVPQPHKSFAANMQEYLEMYRKLVDRKDWFKKVASFSSTAFVVQP